MWLYIISTLIVCSLLSAFAYYLGKKSGSRKGNLDNVIERLSGEMAEKVIFSVPDMIFIVGSDCKILRVLNCDPQKLSVSPDAIIGLRVYDAVDKSCAEDIRSAIQKALESDEVQEVVYTISFKDSVQYFEGRFKRIQEGLVACFERNITHRKETEKKISRMQRVNQIILDNTNSGLVYLDTDYIVQWENVGRYSDNALASKYKAGVCCYNAVMGNNEPCEDCVARKAFQTRKIEQMEVVLDDGLCVAITASPVFDEDHSPLGVVLKFDDMTERRRAAEELRRAKEAAETSDKLKSMFISNMSHEIRTPLNAIVGFSDLLAHTDDPKEKEEFVSVIRRNNELLLQLINDILDLSKIEADTLEFIYDDVDINELLRDLEMSTSYRVDAASGVKLSFVTPLEHCMVHTEKNRIQQVLINLINNAFKFTATGEIRVGYELQDNGLRFYVSDTGKGIPAEKQADIFRRFVKLDNFVSGTGLGLSICQTILNKLGGEIGVESTEGAGSTFWFVLPVFPIDHAGRKEVSSSVLPSGCRSIKKEKPLLLIAEDEMDNYRLYETLLGKKYTLLHAWNGQEAIDLFREHEADIDLIVMDIKMPQVDGYEAIDQIRILNPEVPVIAASAYAFSEDITRIKNSGFNSYIAKPINQAKLFAVLDSFN